MEYPIIDIPIEDAFELKDFRQMDYAAIEKYQLPIELMMENAGLQLARLIAYKAAPNATIQIGIGNGNNGGGGLVAARRLLAWGFNVYLHAVSEITKPLVKTQLVRALRFGARLEMRSDPDIWVDAYLGFSQRLPLGDDYIKFISEANISDSYKISLDLPTGFLGDPSVEYFSANGVLSLAGMKRILYYLPIETDIYISDLGLPKELYLSNGKNYPPFEKAGILQLNRSK